MPQAPGQDRQSQSHPRDTDSRKTGRLCSLAVGLVPIPGVVVKRVDVAGGEELIRAAEDGLRADDRTNTTMAAMHIGSQSILTKRESIVKSTPL